MEFSSILFYVFGFCFVASSAMLVIARNTLKAAMLLILSFFSVASLWLLLEAEFLAITLILVYVGAVMVLFLFVIKMLNIDQSTIRAKFTTYLPLGIFVSMVVIAQIALVLSAGQFDLEVVEEPTRHIAGYSNITELATDLYTTYVYPFELAAVLLLIAALSPRLPLCTVKRAEARGKIFLKQVSRKIRHQTGCVWLLFRQLSLRSQ